VGEEAVEAPLPFMFVRKVCKNRVKMMHFESEIPF
jgi:hypothetical protein